MKQAVIKHINLEDIDYGARARQEYTGIDDLAQSIMKHGLIQPIVVIEKDKIIDIEKYAEAKKVEGELNQDKPYLLLAGGRRLTAYRHKQFSPTIESKVYQQEMTLEQVLSIELYENLDRESLDWREEVKLKKQIHDSWVSIKPKQDGRGGGHTLKDTAKLFNETRQNTSFDIKLAEALEKMPSLSDFKTKSEAKKVLHNLSKVDTREKAVKKVESSWKDDEKGKERATIKLAESYILGNFFDGVEKLEDDTFHLIDLDPPYGIDLHKKKGGNSAHRYSYNEVPADEYPEFLRKTFTECKRVLHPHGWLISWVPLNPWAVQLIEILDELEFIYKLMPLIWHKGSGQTKNPKKNLSSNYEAALYIRKGPAEIQKLGRSNVFNFNPVPHQHKIQPTERPISLLEEIIDTFIEPGNKCLVPFAGSGNTLLACANKHIHGIGYDLSDEYQIGYKNRVYSGEYGQYIDKRSGNEVEEKQG